MKRRDKTFQRITICKIIILMLHWPQHTHIGNINIQTTAVNLSWGYTLFYKKISDLEIQIARSLIKEFQMKLLSNIFLLNSYDQSREIQRSDASELGFPFTGENCSNCLNKKYFKVSKPRSLNSLKKSCNQRVK